uniref:matrix extracellular phosphoglycoprotein n=1 Tax=Jaculus jaculus TaxID=51337 RepID=UPI001E1B49F8|nr:matrix extracellular phosphoglycoprotein [Jaculus jaculus]
MLLVYVGLLLYSVTWAALEETSNANIALHHVDKIKHQEPTHSEIQGREKQLVLFEANRNHQSNESPTLTAKRKTLCEDYGASQQGNACSNLTMPTVPESPGDRGTEGGNDALGHVNEREEFGAVLRSNEKHMKRPVMGTDLWTGKHQEKEPWDALSTVRAGVKQSHQIRRSTQYLKQRNSKKRKIPSDFEGSGSPDIQERGDNDISPFSGDGQPFKDILGQGGAVGPYLESIASETDPGTAELVNSHTSRGGSNEIPGREGHGGQAFGTRVGTVQEAGAAGPGLGEGSNDIIGSTNFRELPGKEGNRVDGGSQNAHGGKVEFHYPQVPSKEKMKERDHDNTESANHNEIPKSGRGTSRKGTGGSNQNEKQSFSSTGKSQGRLTPSHGLHNEIKNEIDSHNGPDNKGSIITLGRKDHYVPHRQNNSPRSKGMSQWRHSWRYRKPHSSRSPPKREDSSGSSDSGSSSESDGD